ncbi:FecR family protein [Alkalispirochaeta americana]|uniref:FecR family protein n=2 Tax=Alkalispirochaeta americana TaxID=159291 RepID=A0A1N6NC61_9SPIO|nr:FecR family protein [Alkalispirochaeta americana]
MVAGAGSLFAEGARGAGAPGDARAERPFAVVIYAEGYDVSIFRNGQLSSYDVLTDDVIGMPLLAGDLVQTDPDTFLEIQLVPSRTVVKVAENTTFEIERLGQEGGGGLAVSYGRLRARVERALRDDPFEVRGFSAVAGVRGTDFGFDTVVDRASPGELQTRVYTFSGSVEVRDRPDPSMPADSAEPQVVQLGANEMVLVRTEVPEALALRDETDLRPLDPPLGETAPARPVRFERRELEEEIQVFWQQQDYREEPLDPAAIDERFPGVRQRVDEIDQERRRLEETRRLREGGEAPALEAFLPGEEIPPGQEIVPDRTLDLQDDRPSGRARRVIEPRDAPSLSRQTRRAGHWMVGLGLALEIWGASLAWYDDGYRSVSDLDQGGASVALMGSGAVLITSGLISYLISLVAD